MAAIHVVIRFTCLVVHLLLISPFFRSQPGNGDCRTSNKCRSFCYTYFISHSVHEAASKNLIFVGGTAYCAYSNLFA